MTVKDLHSRLTQLLPVHADCDVMTNSTDGSEFLANVLGVVANVIPYDGPDFPVVILHLSTDTEA